MQNYRCHVIIMVVVALECYFYRYVEQIFVIIVKI